MKRSQLTDALADYADRLFGPGIGWRRGRTRYDQIQGLLDLAEELQGILIPVEPSDTFRRRLHGELVLEAQRREVGLGPSVLHRYGRGILIGAAALGSVASLVGVIIAFVLHNKNGRATRAATG